MPRPSLSRRAVLLAALLPAGPVTASCTSPPRSSRRTSPPSDPQKEPAIFDLSFDIVSRYRPFELVSPAFVAVTESGVEDTAGGMTVSSESPPAPFCAVELSVAGPRGVLRLGLATDTADRSAHVLGFYDPEAGRAGLEVASGAGTEVVAEVQADLGEAFDLAFVLCENQVTILARRGTDWEPLVTERTAVSDRVDLRLPETLGRYRYAWGARATETGSGITSARAGLFGMAGIRDQHLVQHADGRPYVRDGKVFFTATCAGLGFFQQAHWGVFTLDLSRPERLEQVAQLYFTRDGLVLGDHAGQIVRDDESGRWIVATSSWGDFDFDGVHVRHLETADDVLDGVHVLATERTPLPTEVGAWDPGLTKIDGRWHVSFVESPSQDPFDFHPALARSPLGAHWAASLELVGAASDLHQCEGPILAEVEGRWWLLASDGDHRVYPVFDLEMSRRGELRAPYETNIPHPQLFPRPDGGHWLVTFDGTQYAEDILGYGTHGDVLIMRSDE